MRDFRKGKDIKTRNWKQQQEKGRDKHEEEKEMDRQEIIKRRNTVN